MTENDFLVINSVYLRKIATSAVVGECSGLPQDTVGAVLSKAVDDGTAIDVGDGQFMLTDQGTQLVLGEYRERYAAQRADSSVEVWYERFEVLNKQFLAGISAWQQDSGRGDTGKLDKLLRIVERQVKALDAVMASVDRYGIYRDRFLRALERVDHGESEFVVSPSVDSIHNIWFEFHEDILTLLGRPRDVAEAQA